MIVRVLVLAVAAPPRRLRGQGRRVAAGHDGHDHSTTPTRPPPALTGASTEPPSRRARARRSSCSPTFAQPLHPGFDRVVFEFRNGVPGYDVRYVEPPVHADGSGNEVSVAGGSVLRIRMEPALDADLTKSRRHAPIPGRPASRRDDRGRRARPHRRLRGGADLGDRRESEQPFSVTQLESPARIVIDVATS